MKPTLLLLSACFVFSCAEDTRQRRDASAADSAIDVPTRDTSVDAGAEDLDMDGVSGVMDLCPSTAAGDPVDARGCSTVDTDADGVFNDMDRCDDTPAGTNVDGLGCELENQGTLDATWLINGATATASSCTAAGIVRVRLIIDRAGANFLRRGFPCAQAGFDSREDMTAPRVPRNETFTSYWQALDASGSSIAESDEAALLLRDVDHASLTPPNFTIAE